MFGASSAGRTALLREALSRKKYHVLHFDLRIAGFADLQSSYSSLAAQMEQYWKTLYTEIPGYDEWETEAWLCKVGSYLISEVPMLLLGSMIAWIWWKRSRFTSTLYP